MRKGKIKIKRKWSHSQKVIIRQRKGNHGATLSTPHGLTLLSFFIHRTPLSLCTHSYPIQSLTHQFIHLFIHLFIYSFIHSFIHLSIQPFTQPLTHTSPLHSSPLLSTQIHNTLKVYTLPPHYRCHYNLIHNGDVDSGNACSPYSYGTPSCQQSMPASLV